MSLEMPVYVLHVTSYLTTCGMHNAVQNTCLVFVGHLSTSENASFYYTATQFGHYFAFVLQLWFTV